MVRVLLLSHPGDISHSSIEVKLSHNLHSVVASSPFLSSA